jgi:hypothetical protein
VSSPSRNHDVLVVHHLCPHCWRAVPAGAGERFCPNDGEWLLTACPRCQETILSPYARFCTAHGLEKEER